MDTLRQKVPRSPYSLNEVQTSLRLLFAVRKRDTVSAGGVRENQSWANVEIISSVTCGWATKEV